MAGVSDIEQNSMKETAPYNVMILKTVGTVNVHEIGERIFKFFISTNAVQKRSRLLCFTMTRTT